MTNRTAQASQPPAAEVQTDAPQVAGDMEKVPSNDKVPKYKVMERCYIADKLMESGAELFWAKKPEHYMHPLNAAARNMVREHQPARKDYFEQLPVAPEPQALT